MTQATFPVDLGGDGNTYSDDGTAARDMLNGGHKLWFLPLAGQCIAMAQSAADSADVALSQGQSLIATSTTSTTIGTGAKTFTTQAGKQFTAGQWLLIVRQAVSTTWMLGQVTSYSGTSLVMSISSTNGSGTYTDWSISASGPQGAAGSITNLNTSAKSSAYTAVSGDKGTVIRMTGTWTLALTSAATLAAGWWCWVVNDGTGVITIDPSSTQTINGALTQALHPGEKALLTCNGTLFYLDFPNGLRRLPILHADTVGRTPISRGESLLTSAAGPGGAGNYPNMSYGGSLFVAAPSSGTAGFTSPDGATWTARTWGTGGNHTMYAYGASTHVTGIAGSTTLCRSTDSGVTWGAVTAPANFNDLAFVGSNFVAITNGTGTAAYSSPDGSTWTLRTLPTSQSWNEVASNGSIAIAIGGSSNSFASTTDGLTWTARTGPSGVSGSTCDLFVANGRIFLAQLGRLWWTTDAVTWTEVVAPLGGTLGALGHLNSVYVALIGAAGIFTSTDLDTWAQRDGPLQTGASQGAFTASTYVAPGSTTFSLVYKLRSPSPVGLFAE